jgi:LemA protein
MEPEARIDRMERQGLISKRQAEQLRAGIAKPPAPAQPRSHPARNWLLYLAILVLITGTLLVLLFSGAAGPVQDVSQSLNDTGATGAMNKSVLNIIAVVLLLIIPLVLLTLVYNGLVNREERVFETWAQVESQFQRRADLVPALVETVSAYVRHERDTLTEVTAARSEALQRNISELTASQAAVKELLGQAERLLGDQAQMDRLVELQGALSGRLSGFLALAEDYPELRASDQFLELQAQLEGTENRVNVARLRFNEAVRDFNAGIRRLPGTLVAGLGNFQRKAYFKSEEGADEAPSTLFE